jgi:hypothetical protein
VGYQLVSWVVYGVFFCASLASMLGYCIACSLFKLGVHLRVVPETVCVECVRTLTPTQKTRKSKGQLHIRVPSNGKSENGALTPVSKSQNGPIAFLPDRTLSAHTPRSAAAGKFSPFDLYYTHAQTPKVVVSTASIP